MVSESFAKLSPTKLTSFTVLEGLHLLCYAKAGSCPQAYVLCSYLNSESFVVVVYLVDVM